MKRSVFTDSLLIAALTAILIAPLFRLKYLDRWESIESTFISDARMLSEHLPHPNWQPLWYCGTRFDYVYPPALRYGTALIAGAANLTTARAYHLYTAFFYVFGIVAVYLLVMAGNRSRFAAFLSAAGAALLSPSFIFLRDMRLDSSYLVPQRLHALIQYGEGPHITALSILPAALAASFLALRRWRPLAFAAASLLSALVVANNFYGATALAIFFPIMVWSVSAGERDIRVWYRAAGIAALAYGLSAFWLTPSFVNITLTDLHWVSESATPYGWVIVLVLAVLFGAVSLRTATPSRERQWTLFVAGLTFFLVCDAIAFFAFGLSIAGNPARLVPELDLALILALTEIARYCWQRPQWHTRVALVALIALSPSLLYLRHAWTPFPKSGSLESQYPYKIAKWVHDTLPGERVLPTGEVRFWYDAWYDNPQTDGGSMQGMLNQIIPAATWQAHTGLASDPTVQWMQALGTDAIIVPDKTAFEHYHDDFQHPAKFHGVLDELYNDHHGTVIYRIPRVHPNIGRVVDRNALARAGDIDAGNNRQTVARYVAAIENPDQPITRITWKGFDQVTVRALTAQNESVLLQETYDPNWHAAEDGKDIAVRRDPVMGFMLMDVPAGAHTIEMHFETPTENRAGQGLLALSLLALSWLVYSGVRARQASRPFPASSVPAP